VGARGITPPDIETRIRPARRGSTVRPSAIDQHRRRRFRSPHSDAIQTELRLPRHQAHQWGRALSARDADDISAAVTAAVSNGDTTVGVFATAAAPSD
jgi:hypothetical protein